MTPTAFDALYRDCREALALLHDDTTREAARRRMVLQQFAARPRYLLQPERMDYRQEQETMDAVMDTFADSMEALS